MTTNKGLSKFMVRSVKKVGKMAGDKSNLYRPPYTSTDNLPNLVKKNIFIRVGIGGRKHLECNPGHTEAFLVFGPRNLFQEGDMIFRGTVSDPSLSSGPFTIVQWGNQKATVAIRSSLRGHIAKSYDEDTNTYDYLYKNVYYDLVAQGFGNGYLSKEMGVYGTADNSQQLVLYYREGLYSADYSGLVLLETDNTGTITGRKWRINQIDRSGPLLFLRTERAK